jgi:hypothetical protein
MKKGGFIVNSKNIFPHEVLYAILYFLFVEEKFNVWNYENLHNQIRRLKNDKKYEDVLKDFNFDNLGINPISNKVTDSVFTLVASGLLLLLVISEKEEYVIDERKKDEILLKFSKKELNVLSEIAKKIKESM